MQFILSNPPVAIAGNLNMKFGSVIETACQVPWKFIEDLKLNDHEIICAQRCRHAEKSNFTVPHDSPSRR